MNQTILFLLLILGLSSCQRENESAKQTHTATASVSQTLQEKSEQEAEHWFQEAGRDYQPDPHATRHLQQLSHAEAVEQAARALSALVKETGAKSAGKSFSTPEEKSAYIIKTMKKNLDGTKAIDVSQCPGDFQNAWNNYIQSQDIFIEIADKSLVAETLDELEALLVPQKEAQLEMIKTQKKLGEIGTKHFPDFMNVMTQ